MAIPDFQTIMLPLLQTMSDGEEHNLHEFLDKLAKHFSLSEEELDEMLPSGRQPTFYNRVGWSRTYLSEAGLLEMTRRSYYKITERGKDVLKGNPSRIDMKFLEQFPEYIEFRERQGTRRKIQVSDSEMTDGESKGTDQQTPEELLEDAYQEIRDNLAQEILSLVKKSSPSFFEQLVVELLVKMGYGGSRRDAARAVGQVGDEGIDGIIDEDRLGLDTIYIQAKRWDTGVVGRPEIQKFVGALMGRRARKGIFITTSSFSAEATQYVSNIDSKIVLIDGRRLADLMIDYDVGVTTAVVYQLKRVDSDYFSNS